MGTRTPPEDRFEIDLGCSHGCERKSPPPYFTVAQVNNRKDDHLKNCIRRIREELLENKPVKANNMLEILERHLFGVE